MESSLLHGCQDGGQAHVALFKVADSQHDLFESLVHAHCLQLLGEAFQFVTVGGIVLDHVAHQSHQFSLGILCAAAAVAVVVAVVMAAVTAVVMVMMMVMIVVVIVMMMMSVFVHNNFLFLSRSKAPDIQLGVFLIAHIILNLPQFVKPFRLQFHMIYAIF